MQEDTGGASVQSSFSTTELCVLLSVGVIAVSIVCYTVCNHVCSNRVELGELEELLLQEEESEFIIMKFSHEWSNIGMFTIVSLAVLGAALCCDVFVRISAFN